MKFEAQPVLKQKLTKKTLTEDFFQNIPDQANKKTEKQDEKNRKILNMTQKVIYSTQILRT